MIKDSRELPKLHTVPSHILNPPGRTVDTRPVASPVDIIRRGEVRPSLAQRAKKLGATILLPAAVIAGVGIVGADTFRSDSKPTLQELKGNLPEGTKFKDVEAQAGEGSVAMIERANNISDVDPYSPAVDYVQAQPKVKDGIFQGEDVKIPILPKSDNS